jgi:hypothetical protein
MTYIPEWLVRQDSNQTELIKKKTFISTNIMVGDIGFEPMASAMSTQRSNQLS